jgi:hypothetical protein
MTVLWHGMRLDLETEIKNLNTFRNELQLGLIVSMMGKMDLLGVRNSEGFWKLGADIKALTEAVPEVNTAGHTDILAPKGPNIDPPTNSNPPVAAAVAGSRRDWKRAVLNRLNASPYRDRKDRNPCRVLGTCEWVVSRKLFRDWFESKWSSMLWLSADPGCGKSVLARHLVDSALRLSKSSAVCYFFFKDDFSDQRSVVGALCCIPHQLFERRHNLLSGAILDRFTVDRNGATSISSSSIWETLLEAAQAEGDGEIICVLDAVDERETQGWSQLSQALGQLYSREAIATNFNLKFPKQRLPKEGRG